MPALVGPDTGALDVAAYAEADLAALLRGLGAVLLEVVPADELLELGERGGEVTGVVLEGSPVLEHQAVVVGHLLGLDEVARADLGAVDPEVLRDRVHRPLHREAALRASCPAVRRDDDGVRVEREELDAVRARLVGTQQPGGRDAPAADG